MKRYTIAIPLLVIILALVYGRKVQNPCEGGIKIPCDDGRCILRFWCDGEVDCEDKSDEKYCEAGKHNNCTDKHFECGNGMCVPASLRCDERYDCDDDSDEDNCEKIDEEDSNSFSTTSALATRLETYTLPSTTTFYERRLDETYGNRGYDSRTSIDYRPSPPPPVYYYPPPPPPVYRDLDLGNDDNRSREQNYSSRSSDTFPGRDFPSNHQPTSPPPEPTTQRWSYRTTPRTRTEHDQPRPNNPHQAERHKPMIFPPRYVSYQSPRSWSSSYPRHNPKTPHYSRFYFSENYTADVDYRYESNIREAREWLLSKRDSFYGWGKDTPRALAALSLISNSFQSDVEENELLRKSLQTHLGIKLLRNNTNIERMSTTRLAMYINALLATCQDPRDFMGLDLAEILYYRQSHLEHDQNFVNPLIYLSLCLVDMPVNVKDLQGFLLNSFPSEISKDVHILATIAMACVAQQHPDDRVVKSMLDEAARNLLNEMNPSDGTFGSKYSTALAAQALMSVNTSLRWDHRKTLDYLAEQQEEDGSFGDMQSTYYTLVALSGRSLLHLRNTLCDSSVDASKGITDCSPGEIMNRTGPRKSILYTLRTDYPETFSTGLLLSVPNNTNFYEVMCIGAAQDPRYKFSYKITNNQLGVHTISNLPNDPERGKFWNLYWLPLSEYSVDLNRRYTGDIRRLYPNDGDELLYWYLNDIDI